MQLTAEIEEKFMFFPQKVKFCRASRFAARTEVIMTRDLSRWIPRSRLPLTTKFRNEIWILSAENEARPGVYLEHDQFWDVYLPSPYEIGIRPKIGRVRGIRPSLSVLNLLNLIDLHETCPTGVIDHGEHF